MPLSARVGADFGDFRKALHDVKADLENFGSSTKKLQGDLQRAVSDLGGDKIRREAELIREAVGRIGGASKLTEAEQAKVNRTVTEALAKYKALGMQAPAELQKLAAETGRVQSGMSGLVSSVKGAALGFAAGYASFSAVQGAFRGVAQFGRESVEAFMQQEAAVKQMTVALQAQGTATPFVIGQYKALADQFQSTTVYGNELVIEMQALLTQVGGVMPRDMERALKASTDLAAGMGIDLREATLKVAKAAQGQVDSLREIGLETKDAEGKTIDFDTALERLQAKFGGQAAAEIDTVAGAVGRLGNSFGDLKKAIGESIASDTALREWLLIVTAAVEKGTELYRLSGIGVTSPLPIQIGTIGAEFLGFGAGTGLPKSSGRVKDLSLEALELAATGRTKPPKSGPSVAEAAAAKAAEKAWNDHWDAVAKRSKETTALLERHADEWVRYLRTHVHPAARDLGMMITPSLALQTVPGGGVGDRWGSVAMPYIPSLDGSMGNPVSIKDEASSWWGSNWGKAAQAGMGGALGGLMSGNVGAAVGGTASSLLSMIPMVGSFLAPLGSLFGGLFGGGREYNQVKDQRAQFEQSFGGVEGLQTQLGTAMAALGKPAAETSRLLKDLWNAKDVKAYEAAVQAIQKVMAAGTAELERQKQVKREIADLEGQIAGLVAQQIPTWQEMEQIAQEFGIDTKVLGQNFAQLKTTDVSQHILSQFKRMENGGVAFQDLLNGMADEFSVIVQESQAAGTKLPENMRPILEALAAQGILLDANGERITDLSTLSFGDAVKTDAEKLNDTLDKLRETLEKLVASLEHVDDAASAAFDGWDVPGVPGVPGDDDRGGGGGADLVHHGGFVIGGGRPAIVAHAGLAPDEVPAILQTGEAVLSRRGVRAIGASLIRAANAGVSTTHAGAVGPAAGTPVEVVVHATLQVDEWVLGQATGRAIVPVLTSRGVH